MTGYAKPLPRITPDNRPFWDATRRHQLALQRCADCTRFRYPPAPVCPECLSDRAEWTAVSGRGVVSTFVVFHQRYFTSFAPDIPYNVVQVQLDEGPRLMANLDSYRTILASSVVFKGVAAADLDAVLASSQLVSRQPKELILSEGSPTDGLYVVLEGEVEIFLPERAASGAHRPTRVRLNRLGPGRCVGEYGVIDDRPSSASAEAVTPAKLCFVSKAEFRRLVERH